MAHSAITRMTAALAAAALAFSGSASTGSSVVIVGGTPAQQEMAKWGVGRFAEAGLQLPTIEISFPGRDQSGCGGSPARVYLDHDPIEVRICWNSELMLLHELAHVWEAQNVDESLHDPFMAMRAGVKSWAGLDVAWEERGREHAANVIAWGLLENPYPIARTYPNDPESLTAAFRLVTCTEPLHDGGPPPRELDREFFASRTNSPLETGR